MIVADTCAEHLILPIDISTTILQCDVVVFCILTQLTCRSHVVSFKDVVECCIAIVGHVGSLITTVFGSDDDHTIGGLRTVDGCGCSIAKHINAFDIVGRHHRDVNTRNTIYHVERLHGITRTQRGSTTECNGGSAVRIGRRRNDQSGNLTLQHLTRIGEHTLVQVFSLDGGDGRGNVLTLHRAITDDHDFVQQLIVFLQRNALAGVYGLRLEAYIGHIQLSTAFHVE